MTETTTRDSKLHGSGAFPAFERPAALAAFSILLVAAGMRPALGADALRWKFIPGETLKYTMVQQTSQGMKARARSSRRR